MALEHNAVRERLIRAALDVMEKSGLEGVKARLLAELSGVSVGTIYNVFGSFDRLILAANLRTYEELAALGTARVAEIDEDIARRTGEGTVVVTARDRVFEQLIGLSKVYVDFVSANGNRWSALLAYNRLRPSDEDADNLERLNSLIDVLGNVLEDVPRWGSAAQRRLAARALWSAVHGVVTANLRSGDKGVRQRTTELLELLLTTLVDGMFAEAPAERVR